MGAPSVPPGTLSGASATAAVGEFGRRQGGLTGASATAAAGELLGRSAPDPGPPPPPSSLQERFGPLPPALLDDADQPPAAPPNPPTDLKVELNDASAASDSAPAPETVALETRSQTYMAGSGGLSVEAPPAGLTVKRAKGRRSARTPVGRSVLKNAAQIELTGASLVLQIDQRLESLRQERERLNSEESQAAVDTAISDWDDLRRRVEAFLETASQFAAAQTAEAAVNQKTLSLTDGVHAWWSKRHVQICDKVFDKALQAGDVGLFGMVFGLCLWAGAEPNLSVAIPGAWFGGKPVVEAIKACLKRNRS
jgi:hypothetical protein